MEIKTIENFRLVDRNKASAAVEVNIEGKDCLAEWVFYLQADYCVSIKVGKIIKGDIELKQLAEEVFENRVNIKSVIRPEVQRVRAERRAMMGLD